MLENFTLKVKPMKFAFVKFYNEVEKWHPSLGTNLRLNACKLSKYQIHLVMS